MLFNLEDIFNYSFISSRDHTDFFNRNLNYLKWETHELGLVDTAHNKDVFRGCTLYTCASVLWTLIVTGCEV